ncbi:MAG: condensation domain-containing protein [Candidatus Hodarchaeota archaeon]
MGKTQTVQIYERRITPIERVRFNRAPYTIVLVVTRIKGKITGKMLRNAVTKVQQRHVNLRVRIKTDNNQIPWFTSEGVQEIPIKIVPRESEDHWIQVYHEACKVTFEFEERPAIRLILVQSPDISELLIFSHHIICDGISLAYLARDLMVHLWDPTLDVEMLHLYI